MGVVSPRKGDRALFNNANMGDNDDRSALAETMSSDSVRTFFAFAADSDFTVIDRKEC